MSKNSICILLVALFAFSSGIFFSLLTPQLIASIGAKPEVQIATLADAIHCMHGDGVLIDARERRYFDWGHIINAMNVPKGNFDSLSVEEWRTITACSNIIVYCQGMDCGSAYFAAYKLEQKGPKNIRVYEGGWNEWISCGMPTSGTGRLAQ